MSKFVKQLITDDLTRRVDGVEDALLVNVIGLDANSSVALRRRLREKNINLLVVKNSLARRATQGTPLENAFHEMEGTLALMWGGEDFVSLAKEAAELDKDTDGFDRFEARGGVMDGDHLTADRVKEISKWPSRTEQISILVGQILAPGRNLASQLIAPGGALASQLEQVSEKDEESE